MHRAPRVGHIMSITGVLKNLNQALVFNMAGERTKALEALANIARQANRILNRYDSGAWPTLWPWPWPTLWPTVWPTGGRFFKTSLSIALNLCKQRSPYCHTYDSLLSSLWPKNRNLGPVYMEASQPGKRAGSLYRDLGSPYILCKKNSLSLYG